MFVPPARLHGSMLSCVEKSRRHGASPSRTCRFSLPALCHRCALGCAKWRVANAAPGWCARAAPRLVADGIWPKFDHLNEDAVANWFLKRWPDVRASDALELPATEFACQGLELDYVGLCWGGDLIWTGAWTVRRFSGTKWFRSRRQDAQDFQINTYRVLLTRARAETIIWIPEGEAHDATREPELFDRTAAYLLECGARTLPDTIPNPGRRQNLPYFPFLSTTTLSTLSDNVADRHRG